MKYIRLLLLILTTINIIRSMEQQSGLKGLLLTPVSLKFQAAWSVAQGEIPEKSLPEEVLNFVDLIRFIQNCEGCTYDEKKLFINLLNNPAIPDDIIGKSFPGLIQKYNVYFGNKKFDAYSYFSNRKFTDKQQLLNAILLYNSRKVGAINRPDLVQLALNFGAEVDAKTINGNTALIIAVKDRNDKIAKILIDGHANVNAQNEKGATALILAIARDNDKLVQLLLNAEADVNLSDKNGNTVLMKAIVMDADPKIIQMLLDNKADVNARNKSGQTALTIATEAEDTGLIEMLKKAGAE